jgi:integrase
MLRLNVSRRGFDTTGYIEQACRSSALTVDKIDAGPILSRHRIEESMATSNQRGYVLPRGKQWYGYYRKAVIDPATDQQKLVRVPVILGPKSSMTKTEARRALEREITKHLGQPGSPARITNDGSVTLGWFVNQRFIPLKEAVWKEETANTKKILIRLDIVEPLGDIPLVNFDKFSLQLHLNKLALTRSKDRVLQIRAYIRDIFAEAVDQDFLVKDPARKLKVPAQLRATDTTTLTWDQLRLALSQLPLRDRILLELDMTNALRPSELFAFRWKRFDYAALTLTVAETVYKGKIRDWGKNQEESYGDPYPSESRGRPAGLAVGVRGEGARRLRRAQERVSNSVAGRLHFPKRKWRLSRHGQLSQASASQDRSRPSLAKADFPGDTQNDCDSRSKERDGEGCSGSDAALAHRYHYRRLHAGDPRERPTDDQFHQFGVAEIRRKAPEERGELGFNRCSRQQSPQAFSAFDTK